MSPRSRLGLRGELTWELMPTVTVLLVFAFVEALTSQRLIFASLASSAFLIYLDPNHATDRIRTLVTAQLSGALVGWTVYEVVGPGYPAGGAAMVIIIVLMILLDAVHPPAVSTGLCPAGW